MIVSVCFSVQRHIFATIHLIFTEFFVHVIYDNGSVILWQCCNMLCTSGFIDDIMFAMHIFNR